METAGIVAEYNPFHRGHAWHIAETRRRLGGDAPVVCVMSGHWVQRGECALADKWLRAALALDRGADLVVELPTPWAMASAESFARGAVSLLAATGVVDVLSFGSEMGELAPLEEAAAALDAPDYPERLRAALGRGLSFPAARQEAAGAACLSAPNNNLGVEYLRSLRALGSTIRPLTVPRQGAGHDGPSAGGYASASELRRLLRAGRGAEAAPYLTAPWSGEFADMQHIERAVLARLRTMGEGDWAALPDGGGAEGLPSRLAKAAREAVSLEDFYARAKTRRYPHARLRRLALAAFLGLRAAERPAAPPYVRVLGLGGRGRALLRRMKDTCPLPVIVKPAQARELDGPARTLFESEARYTDLYGLCFPAPRPCGAEWIHSPVVGERA
ncbi:nucleotidyltransferase family protein [Flavonifractor sp. An10]|uniref:tRNA(Met) cytidine acetate ligase n=1 Tax=Flavonifractor sp. An10 TaxID=1965537 RepID=UPI000B3AB663|nr:nucleotidyltransferase family protein [Flavonifractor sp. An10]OUQ83116.1 nucleotidyltransferase [Flavonifractor sp. An10]